MSEPTDKGIQWLKSIGIKDSKSYWNLTASELIEETLRLRQGVLTDTKALAVDTGEFTGRSPKDKYIVWDEKSKDVIWWGEVNFKFDTAKFESLYDKVVKYLSGKNIYVRDSFACADKNYRLSVRTITELPWSNLFANNLFIRPGKEELAAFAPEWTIINAPGFRAEAATDGTRQHNFTILDLTRKIILIGGSGYTGEIKKSIFTLLNYILPHEKGVLSMHCSANVGKNGDTAIFFGLSGTGKTTLSADPNRGLIGDDEHGWADKTIFNFEGGCYAKCVNLSQEKEPQIFNAVREGALLENVRFLPGTKKVNYNDISVTENTRVGYPIHFIDNAVVPSVGGIPKNIFFLTCDAFGVLPPISKLTTGQAMYHFISGYTAKVAGTEMGVTEPTLTFSACFGKAFLPLHPTKYAELLGKKLKENKANVWLVNTGWTGGSYGTGNRTKLSHTRALITAALNGDLEKVRFDMLPVFNLNMPSVCPGVPTEILNPRNTWKDKNGYDAKANELAMSFVKNFQQYSSTANDEILAAAPKIAVNA
ncbi:MAG: phosphoenolpyruvate carboxykinase (ATP) [Bacteroidetes bacterium]|nr:MAG: phosphoenolpyruvate carboxykinase (ATP) [Bacteroidota bacterium]